MCLLYIAGLIGPGDRKSVQPIAARAGEVGHDQLHHFISAGIWDGAPLEATLLKQADRLVGDTAGFLVIDDTAMPKKGKHSVGLGAQYASSFGSRHCSAAHGENRQLPGVGLGNAGLTRSAGDDRVASVPAGSLDRRRRAYDAGRRAEGASDSSDEAGDSH